ncbi:MAG: DUF1272 domain-containing protein [Gammaproteobacteria bacterium]
MPNEEFAESETMLSLRPNCEYCDRDLGPQATDAMICSYECTFCQSCVESILHNVCPNCGGGFAQRPIRPTVARRPGVSLIDQPASTKRVHTKYSLEEINEFSERTAGIAPQER